MHTDSPIAKNGQKNMYAETSKAAALLGIKVNTI